MGFASISKFSGFLVLKPTTGIPAATPAFIPETESYQIQNTKNNIKFQKLQMLWEYKSEKVMAKKKSTPQK